MNASEGNASDGDASDENASVASGLLAIDVGSSRVKLGWFPPVGECTSDPYPFLTQPSLFPIAVPKLPQPEATLAVSHCNGADMEAEINAWLGELDAAVPRRFVGSVHPAVMARVQEIFGGEMRGLAAADLPVEVRVEHPERVGIDRLLNAVAVNRVRQPQRPAIVVDLGTACTVDFISADGAFEGGAILPGTTLSATALHSGTATLPQLTTEKFDSPPEVIGKSTQAAISSGIYWGLVGAVRALVDRMSRECSETPQLFLTGGEATRIVTHLADDVQPPRHIPHLVLSGIALVAEKLP